MIILLFFLDEGDSKLKKHIGPQTGHHRTGHAVRMGARPLFVHVHVEILISDSCVLKCKWAEREGSCVLGAGSESKGTLEISFLHLHLTHFTTLLFRQHNHFNNCLPSSAPMHTSLPPSLPPRFLLTRKDDVSTDTLAALPAPLLLQPQL